MSASRPSIAASAISAHSDNVGICSAAAAATGTGGADPLLFALFGSDSVAAALALFVIVPLVAST